MKRKLTILVVSVLSLLCCFLSFNAVSGTLAYYTDKEDIVNITTVGKVTIELTEPDWPGNDSEDVKFKLANEEIPKNPTITNTGTNDAVVFIKLTVPVVNTIAVYDDGTKEDSKNQEIFFFKDEADATSVHQNNFDSNWVELPDHEAGTNMLGTTRTYVFGYKTRIAKDFSTTALFDKIQLKKTLEGNIPSGTSESIKIDAYGIQADEIIKSSVIDTSGNMDADTLSSIYQIFINQNGLD